MYSYEIKPSLQKILKRLSKRDSLLYERVINKIEEIAKADIEHYKNLRYDLKGEKRVHIGHFVLVFEFVKERNEISFLDFDHHDRIYDV